MYCCVLGQYNIHIYLFIYLYIYIYIYFFFFKALEDADLLKGTDLMITSNHYLTLENEVIEIYLQRMNPDLLVGKIHSVEVLCCL